ncbi:MAG: cobaltochelatase subunit CobN [Candidatus Hodgkinia cicadicola]
MPHEFERLNTLTSAVGGWRGCQALRRKLVEPLRSGSGSVVLRTSATSAEETAGKLLLTRLRALSLTGSVRPKSHWSGRSTSEVAKVRPVCVLSSIWFGLTFARTALAFQIVNSCLPLRQAIFGRWGICPWELPSKVWIPEGRGAIVTRAISFNRLRLRLATTAFAKTAEVVPNRINLTNRLVSQWTAAHLRPQRVGFILANYPATDARIGCAVGLDSLTSVQNLDESINRPRSRWGGSLIERLTNGVTNSGGRGKIIRGTISVRWGAKRLGVLSAEVTRKWGPPELDPFVVSGFCLISAAKSNNFRTFIQPTRGYGLVKSDLTHSAFITPCTFYCLTYLFYRRVSKGGLLVNVGKHGNLEWLPGKAVALSRKCWPEVVSKASASVYFYVSNDPGEGLQAKRRINSVVISHDIAPVNSAGALGLTRSAFKGYRNLTEGFVCNLMDMHFRCKLHTLCDLNLRDAISTSVLLSKRGGGRTEVWELIGRMSEWWKAKRGWLVAEGVVAVLMHSAQPLATSVESDGLCRTVCLRVACCFNEVRAFAKALKGNFIEPGLSVASSRSNDGALPSGRNFYTKGMVNSPDVGAYVIGLIMARKLVERFYLRSGRWPKHVALSVWATSNMRTGGDDVALIYALVGAKPIWNGPNLGTVGFEVIPLAELRRPRVCVLVRVSGLFRDACSKLVERLHRLLDAINKLGEYQTTAESSVFSSAEGTFGAGIQEMLDGGTPVGLNELGEKFITYGCWKFNGLVWKRSEVSLVENLKTVEVVAHSQDNYEHDVLDSDDYYQFEGGLNAAVRRCRRGVCAYHLDSSAALRGIVKVRRLRYEIARLVTCKLCNLGWLGSMLSHGYRGASEVLANVNHFCNFAVLTGQVSSVQLESVREMFATNRNVALKMRQVNEFSLEEVLRKLSEVDGKTPRGLGTNLKGIPIVKRSFSF